MVLYEVVIVLMKIAADARVSVDVAAARSCSTKMRIMHQINIQKLLINSDAQ